MYRVDSLYSEECGYLKLFAYTRYYRNGEGFEIKAQVQDMETKEKQVIDGDKLYQLIGDNKVIFGAVFGEFGARAVTLCTDVAASVYKDFSYVGSYTEDEFYNMIDSSNRKKATNWVEVGQTLAIGNDCSIRSGIIDLDYLVLKSPKGVSFYSTLARHETADKNTDTNLLDFFLSADIGTEVFLDGKRFFIKERGYNHSFVIHCYNISGKLLLEVI